MVPMWRVILRGSHISKEGSALVESKSLIHRERVKG